MDALILRAAITLCLPVSAVAGMQASDVLAVTYAAGNAAADRIKSRTLAAVEMGYVVNAAVNAPEKLKEMDESARRAAGIVLKATPLPAALEAMLATLPLEDADGAKG